MAVENYNSKTGEKWADFIPAVIWGKQAENTAKNMMKGSQIAICGRIYLLDLMMQKMALRDM